ncbi:P-loop containing nucleoside triphosphate hydrolase protein [Artomyces pyxidatus]|uniref:P-loop containing nucleoside triphosphate hydrolase protein n=1 Tax=Artomyces pyxidatus TaxID=48021 RepID=A0ACB8STT7_9AGAM|nr:P-loop containing nucleoside triphosphate hydrolase protein [Artomyces pyxidatus]
MTVATVPTTLTPRSYQEEIFSKAQQGNVIAALDTGSGKTYISTLLIKWIASQDAARGKLIVFLVPKVALVEQQGDFISKHTPLRVRQFHGGTAVNIMDRSKWKDQLEKSDVLVMTAQIFLNILTHSYCTLKNVSLIIMDECHHTRKNHPYNGVMKEYFQLSGQDRPKIFGMTASPTWSTKRPEEALATLEKNLDAKVITVKQHAEELHYHSPKPIEVVRAFPPPPEAFLEYPVPSIWSRFDRSKIPITIDIPWDSLLVRYDVTKHNLGPFAAELFLHSDLQARVVQLMQASNENEMEILRMQYLSVSEEGMMDTAKKIAPEILDLHEILLEYQPFLDFHHEKEDLPGPWAFNMDWCTPKVRVLIEILIAHHTPQFQGIIFVEQRHIASCLAQVISRIPQLKGMIKCASFVGHGSDDSGTGGGMRNSRQRDIVKDFRDRKINLLIATPVAEEGFDFPACDLVVRFDSLQHMVGYVQSRGRARHKDSTFVIMVQEGNALDMLRYKAFIDSEPEIKQLYHSLLNDRPGDNEDDDSDEVCATDLAARERFVVPSTGAVLSYNTAIGLLGHLCALIPSDPFTPSLQPRYTGDFTSTLHLPTALPLPREHLVYVGPTKGSKKEAKRAVAFLAVKALYVLNVFDDYLLPTRSAKDHEDVDGRPVEDVSNVPAMMDVVVRDPWTLGPRMWSHPVSVDGRRIAALVTGTPLRPVELSWNGKTLRTHVGEVIEFDEDEERRQRALLQDYTDLGLWWCVSSRPRADPLSCYLIPTYADSCQPNFDGMERLLEQPHGSYDWTAINESHYDHVLIMNNKEHGRPYLIHRIRRDLSPMSKPPAGSREDGFPTFRDYYLQKYTRRGVVPEIPFDGCLVEAYHFARQTSAAYHLPHTEGADVNMNAVDDRPFFLPFAFCRWFSMPEDMFRLYHFLPRILHRVSDVWRARGARADLGLPPIQDNLFIEAFTLPGAGAGYNNQRLETLGDAVLKLGASVHLFNKFPHRHEGQLDALRRQCISNRTLLARAKENGLEHHLTGEKQNIKTWRFIVSEGSPCLDGSRTDRRVHRRMARRSLQDCMEAILGASYLTGGLSMALQTGTALGLNLGGTVPWSLRYSRPPHSSSVPALFLDLQKKLGYEFHRSEILLESMTHPSFPSNSASYQRLEFMGDAVIDLVVMTYLYNKYPRATSGQLSCARARAVCAPVLASVAIRRLGLHNLILMNNTELSMAISKYVPILETTSTQDIVMQSWAHDPPKAISDVMESLVAAILVDSAYNLDKTAAIVETIMEEILEVLSPDMRPDPVSELMVWTARSGCRRICLQKSRSRAESKQNDTVCVVVHGVTVAGPVTASNLPVARAFASERARVVLQDVTSDRALGRLCDCGTPPSPAPLTLVNDLDDIISDDIEIGFATLAQRMLEELVDPANPDEQEAKDDSDDEGGSSGEESNENWISAEESDDDWMSIELDYPDEGSLDT